jgi:signal transduction histidine kinase/predicted RNA-binding protein with RPS1 domain
MMTSRRDVRAAHPKGAVVDCVVRRVEPFGVFVDLEGDAGVSGFIRPREWAWERRGPGLAQSVSRGDRVRARVIEQRQGRLELSRRLALPNPYLEIRKSLKVGDVVRGQVDFIAPREGGVSLVLENGLDGFIPRSELPDWSVRQESFGLLAQDWVEARILEFREDETILSVKEHIRLRDQAEARGGERLTLKSHPTVGVVLEDLSLTLQLQEIPEPEIPENLRTAIRRILIVEDNDGVSESLEMVLEHLGFPCDLAKSIEQARERLRETAYDLVILDLNLPGEKGDQLVAELRSGPPPRHVIVLTAAAEQDWSALIGSGGEVVSGFFQKPTSVLRILEHLHPSTGSRAPAADDRGHPAGFGGGTFRPDDLARWSGRGLRGGRRERIDALLRALREETNASRAFVLSYRPGSLFELVAGDFVELTREVQQDLDVSPIGNLIRRHQFLSVPDISKRTGQFQHLLRILPAGSLAGCPLAYADDAEYGLFLLGEQAHQLRHVSEERLRVAAALIGNLIAEEKLDAVVTGNQGLLLTGFLADSLLHEIKNAVQAMSSYSAVQARLVKRHATDLKSISTEETVELKKATLGIRSITEQLEDLVLLFRNLAGSSETEEVDLGQTLRRLLATVQPLAEDKGVVLEEPVLEGEIPALRVDPKLLDQAVLNVLINAIEQMEEGAAGRRVLRITASFAPDLELPVVLAISDTGPGIHFVHRERIFDLFFSTKKRGTGLGLYVSRTFVEQIGGALRLGESFLFSGSTFLIELPREVLS